MPAKELADGCKIISHPPLNEIVQYREGRVGCQPAVPELVNYGLHIHTVAEEIKTICNRHLFKVPTAQIKTPEWRCFTRAMLGLSRKIGRVSVTPVRKLLEGRTGRRRRRFWSGIQEYYAKGITKKDARITEMQKLEFYAEDKIEIKEDRGIQYRSTQYNVALARFVHGFEAKYIGMHLPYKGHQFYPTMKGKTPQQMAQLLFEYASWFEDPVFWCIDHSRYDAHWCRYTQYEEHKLYLRANGWDQELVRLLMMQRKNFCISKGGVKYIFVYKRGSGEVTTSAGNGGRNHGAIQGWLDWCGIEGVFGINGDDVFAILERKDLHKVKPLEDFMLKIGLVTEYTITDNIWEVEFCQSRPCLLPSGVTFVRNPYKVLATLGRTAEKRDDASMRMVLRSSALSELAVEPGCPVTNAYAKRILQHYGEGRWLSTPDQLYKQEAMKIDLASVIVSEVPEPDVLARLTYYKAWGISPGEQELLENVPIAFYAPTGTEKRKRLKCTEYADLPSDVYDLGQVEPTCECGNCPVF
nr:MAG: RNA-dependent RNA polymerase [Riboviria sp.]